MKLNETYLKLFPGYPDALSLQQASEMLNLNRHTVGELIRSRRLFALRIGRTYRIPKLSDLDMSSTGAVSSAAVNLAYKLNAKAIVAYTQTGSTVHRVSRERPSVPIFGITNNEHTYHWLALSWGTESFLIDEDYHDKSRRDLMEFTDNILKEAGKVTDGDKIVVLSSAQGEHQPGSTDSIYVHTVGASQE